jgi:hypothetical protein
VTILILSVISAALCFNMAVNNPRTVQSRLGWLGFVVLASLAFVQLHAMLLHLGFTLSIGD